MDVAPQKNMQYCTAVPLFVSNNDNISCTASDVAERTNQNIPGDWCETLFVHRLSEQIS